MNDRSATTRSTRPPIASGVRPRALVRSRTTTRGSLRSDHASWPYPTSAATTWAAPRSSSTSVNPPVDAPASRQRRPATAIANASSAPTSLCAPRDTQARSLSVTTVSAVVSDTAVAGLTAGSPSMRTLPAPINSAAC